MKVYFSHGKESGPWGSKITRLAELAKMQGCSVESVDYTNIHDPDLRVKMLVDILATDECSILVGSSMGGYASLVASERISVKGVFLLAPALYMPGYEVQNYNAKEHSVEIVHGWSDDIIPPENSIRFARESDSALHLIPGDHRLNYSMKIIEPIFNQFISSMLEN